MGRTLRAILPALIAGLGGCAGFDCPPAADLQIKTVAVLPAVAPDDARPEADYASRPAMAMSDLGYRVVPLEEVEQRLRGLGIDRPALVHDVPLQRLRELFDADAVLYIVITRQHFDDWFRTVDTTTRYTLRDARNGAVLWQKTHRHSTTPPGMNIPDAVATTVSMAVGFPLLLIAVPANAIDSPGIGRR